MRLIDTWTFALEEFDEDVVPGYAILSHTWEDEEVTYADMEDLDLARTKKGFSKIAHACALAIDEGLRYCWVDTCCIDKSSSAELQEAINSMWRWYSQATVCYAFLTGLKGYNYLTDDGAYRRADRHKPLDVSDIDRAAIFTAFTRSRWFTRGWCLQELIAPKVLRFYSLWSSGDRCKLIGEKSRLVRTISEATNIDATILEHTAPLSSISVAQRMSWAAKRKTRRVEDQAYSLLGIFDVSMPMLYGEGKRAFIRLQEEIMRTNSDHSLFAWERDANVSPGALLATSPANFADASRIVQWGHGRPFEMTGLRITLPLLPKESSGLQDDIGILYCRYNDSLHYAIGLRLSDRFGTNERNIATTSKSHRLSHKKELLTGRLEIVSSDEAKAARDCEMLIGRTFEPRSSNVRFLLNVDPTRADPAHDYLEDTYSERKPSTTGATVFSTTRKAVARAGVMLRYPSGRRLSLVFGFDRYPPNNSNGVLLPGVWAKFHRGPQKLKDIIKVEAIHAHGRKHTCADPRKDGCPFMPPTAHVDLYPEGDVLDVSMRHEYIFEEDVFVVDVVITQQHEIGGSMPSTMPRSITWPQKSSLLRIGPAQQRPNALNNPYAPAQRGNGSGDALAATNGCPTDAIDLDESPQPLGDRASSSTQDTAYASVPSLPRSFDSFRTSLPMQKDTPPTRQEVSGAQDSHVSQQGRESMTLDPYNDVNGRMSAQVETSQAPTAAAAADDIENIDLARQDYEIQMMLQRQEDWGRLLQARREQDFVAIEGQQLDEQLRAGPSPPIVNTAPDVPSLETGFLPDIPRIPSPPCEQQSVARRADPHPDLTGTTYSSWGVAADSGHVAPPWFDSQLSDPMGLLVQRAPLLPWQQSPGLDGTASAAERARAEKHTFGSMPSPPPHPQDLRKSLEGLNGPGDTAPRDDVRADGPGHAYASWGLAGDSGHIDPPPLGPQLNTGLIGLQQAYIGPDRVEQSDLALDSASAISKAGREQGQSNSKPSLAKTADDANDGTSTSDAERPAASAPGRTYASWGVAHDQGHSNPPDLEPQLNDGLVPQQQVLPGSDPTPWQEDPNYAYDSTVSHAGHGLDYDVGDNTAPAGSKHIDNVAGTEASEAFVADVQGGAIGPDGAEDFCVEEVD